MATTYKIGEAAALLNLKTYVLRFWETEFPDIVPLRTEKGQRLYTDEHLALLERIRFLLHERGLTIGGARKILAEEKERGMVYVFGAPAAPDPAGITAPPEEAFAGAEAEEGDCADDETAAYFFPDPSGAFSPAAPGEPRQCNLPGLEALVAIRNRVLGEAPVAPADAEEDEFPPPREDGEAERQGMLPLFAVAKAAWLAGRASGGNVPEGGHNFIAAGAPELFGAGTSGQPGAERSPAIGIPSGLLGEVLAELEEIAALLEAEHPVVHREEDVS